MTATAKNLTVAENARKLAAFLEAHPDLPEPTHFNVQYRAEVKWLIWENDLARQKRTAESVVRFLPGKADKRENGDWFEYSGEVDGVKWEVVAAREAVCERVVTGTRTVTRTVPDPAVDVPLVEVTEEVETVEWVCAPLLAGATA